MKHQTKTTKTNFAKSVLIFLAVFAFSFASFSQEVKYLEESEKEPDFLLFAEQMPEFPGGKDALRRFIFETIRYPIEAMERGEQGRVILQFVVRKTGEITNITVARGVSSRLDAEAIRVVEAMPNWIPGKQDGEKVSVKYTLPVNFVFLGVIEPVAPPRARVQTRRNRER